MPAPMLSPFHEAVTREITEMTGSWLEPLPYDPNYRSPTSLTETGDLANKLGDDCVAATIRYFR